MDDDDDHDDDTAKLCNYTEQFSNLKILSLCPVTTLSSMLPNI
jgi:hypothetical protein